MRRAINLLMIALALPLMAGPAQAAPNATCKPQSLMTLSGTIRTLQSMREEPQAEIETYFDIALSVPVCGKTTVTASTIGRIACKVGDSVIATGEFDPPSKMFDTARLRVNGTVSCTPQK